MRLTSLSLVQFRNLSAAQFEFDPDLTIFLGPNGSGKSNILEAISLLSLPRSFRGSKDDQMRQWQTDFARIEGQVELDQGQHRSLVIFLNGGKKLQMDGQPQTATEFIGQFLSTLFAPEEVDLLAGPPSRRRAFLDAHFSELSRSYFSHLLHYQKVLTRKNRLLAARARVTELEYWNEQQVMHGSALIKARQIGVSRFNELLSPTLQIKYINTLEDTELSIEANFQKKQASMIDRERIVGHSLMGPQRDDWRLVELSPTPRDLGIYGSRGEQRMSVIALKRVQLNDLQTQTGQRAILLLDDVLSELDAQNQAALLSSLGQQQTILTTASLTDVPKSLLSQALIYERVDSGWQVRQSVK